MPRRPLSPAQLEAHRKSNREYARRKKLADPGAVRLAQRLDWKKRNHKRNEQKRARTHRHRKRHRHPDATGPRRSIQIVTEREIKFDLTRWRGPGYKKAAELERIADAYLKKGAAILERNANRAPVENQKARTPEGSAALPLGAVLVRPVPLHALPEKESRCPTTEMTSSRP
jgi:hypothetical protein